jgi:hypothetical protein
MGCDAMSTNKPNKKRTGNKSKLNELIALCSPCFVARLRLTSLCYNTKGF